MGTVLFLVIGSSVDVARWMNSRSKTLKAIDAAVLAGGRSLQTNNSDWAAAVAIAKAIYTENVSTGREAIADTFEFQVADNGTAMTVTGAAYVETSFLKLARIDKLPLLKLDGSEYAKAVLRSGGNADTHVEIALMLDTSSSMSGTKFADLKAAAKDLINITVYENQSHYTARLSLAPFRHGQIHLRRILRLNHGDADHAADRR